MEGSKKKLKTVEQPEVQTSPCPWRQPWKKRKFDSLSESIRFPKKRNVRFDCTGCWRLSAKPPIDGLPQLTRQSRSRHTSACHHSSLISHMLQGSTPYTAPSQAAAPPTSWVTAKCGRIESDESIIIDFLTWIESNRNYFWRIGMLYSKGFIKQMKAQSTGWISQRRKHSRNNTGVARKRSCDRL